jgi:predicted  nucleic acid-binding Zn-ribbon protein
MHVRCSFCGAEYEAAVTKAALSLVGRCERCGRARLRSAEAESPARGPERGRDEPREDGRPDAAA